MDHIGSYTKHDWPVLPIVKDHELTHYVPLSSDDWVSPDYYKCYSTMSMGVYWCPLVLNLHWQSKIDQPQQTVMKNLTNAIDHCGYRLMIPWLRVLTIINDHSPTTLVQKYCTPKTATGPLLIMVFIGWLIGTALDDFLNSWWLPVAQLVLTAQPIVAAPQLWHLNGLLCITGHRWLRAVRRFVGVVTARFTGWYVDGGEWQISEHAHMANWVNINHP